MGQLAARPLRSRIGQRDLEVSRPFLEPFRCLIPIAYRSDRHSLKLPFDMRIVIDRPVGGLLHSLQSKEENTPLDPKASESGNPLILDFPVRIAPGPRFLGDQDRREGPERRFVYIRVEQAAGDSPQHRAGG